MKQKWMIYESKGCMLQMVIGCREWRWRRQGNEDGRHRRDTEKGVRCGMLSGSEDERARGPVAPRGIVATVEKVRTSETSMLLPGRYRGEFYPYK